MMLTLICSTRSSKYGGILEILSSCGVVVTVVDSIDGVSELRVSSSFQMSFDENLFVVSFSSRVSSERHIVSHLIVTSSILNVIFHSSCNFYLNLYINSFFSRPYLCFSNI